jgi:capsular polysaccharide transport system permease protein
MTFMFSVVRVNSVGGIDATIWLMFGMLAFFTFRRTANQCMNAISANRALFTYRQVKPVDTVLVRAGTEGFLMFLVFVILLAGLGLFGHDIVPADPLALGAAIAGLWLNGLGFGLITSVAVVLVPELRRIIGFILTPLYLMSGVMVQMSAVPEPYRSWLALNPLVHGIESARLALAPYYHTISALSISYLYGFALVLIFLGLALHVRFATRMVME